MRVVKMAVGVLWALAFFAAAAVQYNDPDPFVWMSFYGLASVVAVGVEPERFRGLLNLVRGVWLVRAAMLAAGGIFGFIDAMESSKVALDWAQVFGPGDMMSAGVEEMRESLGAILVMWRLGWLVSRWAWEQEAVNSRGR